MSKGTILSYSGDSLYSVDVEYFDTYAKARIGFLEENIPTMQQLYTNSETEVDKLEEKYGAATLALSTSILVNGPTPAPGSDEYKAIIKATDLKMQAEIEYSQAKSALFNLDIAIAEAEKELQKWQDILVETETMSLYPVDYCDGDVNEAGVSNGPELSGEVDLIACNRVGDRVIQIRPGYSDGATYTGTYGQIGRNVQESDSAVVWNWTMLNPYQKWKPFMRAGHVSSVDYENSQLTVSFDFEYSPVGNVSLPKTLVCTAEYMSCDVLAFRDGDHVVVEMSVGTEGDLSSYSGKVIGFYDRPRECPKTRAFLVKWNGTYYRIQRDINGDWQTLTGEIGGTFFWENTDTRRMYSWTNSDHYLWNIGHELASGSKCFDGNTEISAYLRNGYLHPVWCGKAKKDDTLKMIGYAITPTLIEGYYHSFLYVYEYTGGSWVEKFSVLFSTTSSVSRCNLILRAAKNDLSKIELYNLSSGSEPGAAVFDLSDMQNITADINVSWINSVIGSYLNTESSGGANSVEAQSCGIQGLDGSGGVSVYKTVGSTFVDGYLNDNDAGYFHVNSVSYECTETVSIYDVNTGEMRVIRTSTENHDDSWSPSIRMWDYNDASFGTNFGIATLIPGGSGFPTDLCRMVHPMGDGNIAGQPILLGRSTTHIQDGTLTSKHWPNIKYREINNISQVWGGGGGGHSIGGAGLNTGNMNSGGATGSEAWLDPGAWSATYWQKLLENWNGDRLVNAEGVQEINGVALSSFIPGYTSGTIYVVGIR